MHFKLRGDANTKSMGKKYQKETRINQTQLEVQRAK